MVSGMSGQHPYGFGSYCGFLIAKRLDKMLGGQPDNYLKVRER